MSTKCKLPWSFARGTATNKPSWVAACCHPPMLCSSHSRSLFLPVGGPHDWAPPPSIQPVCGSCFWCFGSACRNLDSTCDRFQLQLCEKTSNCTVSWKEGAGIKPDWQWVLLHLPLSGVLSAWWWCWGQGCRGWGPVWIESYLQRMCSTPSATSGPPLILLGPANCMPWPDVAQHCRKSTPISLRPRCLWCSWTDHATIDWQQARICLALRTQKTTLTETQPVSKQEDWYCFRY